MSIKEKLKLMDEMKKRNDERWQKCCKEAKK